MALETPTDVVLSLQGDNISSTNYFSTAQGFYAQTSVPDVGLDNVVALSITSTPDDTIVGPDYTISFTKTSGGGLQWFIGGAILGGLASGSYTALDVFAIKERYNHSSVQRQIFRSYQALQQHSPRVNRDIREEYGIDMPLEDRFALVEKMLIFQAPLNETEILFQQYGKLKRDIFFDLELN